MKPFLFLCAVALLLPGCRDSATQPALRWSSYAGEWRVEADQSSPSYHNCRNVNAAEGGIRVRLSSEASFEGVTGTHNGGWGGTNFSGSVSGSLIPPSAGTLRLQRPEGSGTLTLTSVTPTRMEGELFTPDPSFADPASGRTPCRFRAVLVRP
jgi:hypothetical protein